MPEAGTILGFSITRADKFPFCSKQRKLGFFPNLHILTPDSDHAEKMPQTHTSCRYTHC